MSRLKLASRHHLVRQLNDYPSFRFSAQGKPDLRSFTTRFAPSPTGYLHLGHVASALYAQRVAGAEGRFIIRIEDIDSLRCRPEYVDALLEDLAWLGIRSDLPVMFQSQQIERYRQAMQELRRLGVVYPCTCTRQEVARAALGHDPDGAPLYVGNCREKGCQPDRSPLWRLDMSKALHMIGASPGWSEVAGGTQNGKAESFGDVIIGRRDNGISYHLCVVCDDAAQGVTCVTRGEDLRASTSVHRVLQTLLNLPEPVYAHHALVNDPQGRKLSKTRGSTALRDLRRRGFSPSEILGMAGPNPYSVG